MDPPVVLQCIRNLSSPEANLRNQSEAHLMGLAPSPGYTVLLAKFLMAPSLPVEVRQMSGMVLKKVIKDDWDIKISDEDRCAVKQGLPQGLLDPERQVTSIVGMIIGEISAYDFPDEWPTLVDDLLGMIQAHAQSSPTTVYGCVRCIEAIAEKTGDDQLFKLTGTIIPAAMAMVQADYLPVNIKRRCMRTMFHVFKLASYVPARQNVLVKHLDEIIKFLIPLVFDGSSLDACILQAEAIPLTIIIVNCWLKHMVPVLPDVFGKLWHLLTGFYDTYYTKEVGPSADEDWESGYTTEGETVSKLTVLAQMLELLCSLLGTHKMKAKVDALITPNLNTLCRLMVGYGQLSVEMADSWDTDLNEFIKQDEFEGYVTFDPMFGAIYVRDIAMAILDNICGRYQKEGIHAVLMTCSECLAEASKKKANGDAAWWKLREAALKVLGMVCENNMKTLKKVADPNVLIEAILGSDLPAAEMPPLLQSRGFLTLSSFLSYHAPPLPILQQLWDTISSALASTTATLPVKITACKSLPRLCQMLPTEITQPAIPAIIASLCQILPQVTEETLSMTLTTLTQILKLFPEIPTGTLAGDLLRLWDTHKNDPLATQSICDLYGALCRNTDPSTTTQIESLVLPSLLQVLNQHEDMPALVENAVEILTDVCKHSTDSCGQTAVKLGMGKIIHLLMHSEDNTLCQCACSCLRAMVYRGKNFLPTFEMEIPGQPKELALSLLIRLLGVLFSRDYGDKQMALNFAGGLITQIIKDCGASLPSDTVPTLLKASMSKLEQIADKNSFLSQSLIMVFVHLMQTHYTPTIQFLLNHSISGGNGFQFLMKVWLNQQLDFFGRGDRCMSTRALIQLQNSPELATTMVSVKSSNFSASLGKTRSQSKSKAKGPEFVTMPFSVAVFIVLSKLAIKEEEYEKEKADNNDDEDGDEYEDEDDEEDEDFDEEDNPGKGHNFLSDLLDDAEDDEDDDDDDAFYHQDSQDQTPLIDNLKQGLKQAIPKQDLPSLQSHFSEKERQSLMGML